jgi:predicted RNase H-like HicB family nuclease
MQGAIRFHIDGMKQDGLPVPGPSMVSEKMRYAIVIEKTNTGYSAYVPDLPAVLLQGIAKRKSNAKCRVPFVFTSTA